MRRRTFLARTGGLTLAIATGASRGAATTLAPDRVGLGTVTLRHRFAQTRLKGSALPNPLTLREVPAYYRERFEVRKLEFWSNHFESLAPSYLRELRQRVKA